MPAFARTIGIDYSGAETPTASLKGLRVYLADGDALPVEVPPPPNPRKYWTRKGIAEWLVERLAEDVPTLVGIDHRGNQRRILPSIDLHAQPGGSSMCGCGWRPPRRRDSNYVGTPAAKLRFFDPVLKMRPRGTTTQSEIE